MRFTCALRASACRAISDQQAHASAESEIDRLARDACRVRDLGQADIDPTCLDDEPPGCFEHGLAGLSVIGASFILHL